MKESRISELGRVGDTVYGVAFVLCANPEVFREKCGAAGIDDDATRCTMRAAADVVYERFDYEREAEFRAYNGGYASGYRLAEPIYFVCEVDREYGEVIGETPWVRIGGDRVPEALSALAVAVADAAETEARKVFADCEAPKAKA